jgi:Holliday junction resolvase RusA-like endonuclease
MTKLSELFPHASASFLKLNGAAGGQSSTQANEKPVRATQLPLLPDNAPKSISLVLPYPPSANRYWRFVVVRERALVLLSGEARAYKKAIATIAKAKVPHPMTGPLSVYLRIFRPRKAGDLSNRIKVVEDALNKVCYADDNQIERIVAERFEDKNNPRVEILIEPL